MQLQTATPYRNRYVNSLTCHMLICLGLHMLCKIQAGYLCRFTFSETQSGLVDCQLPLCQGFASCCTVKLAWCSINSVKISKALKRVCCWHGIFACHFCFRAFHGDAGHVACKTKAHARYHAVGVSSLGLCCVNARKAQCFHGQDRGGEMVCNH